MNKLKELTTLLSSLDKKAFEKKMGIKSLTSISEALKTQKITIEFLSGKKIELEGIDEIYSFLKGELVKLDLNESLSKIESDLSEFSLEQIKTIQNQLKNLEEKIKDSQKSKIVKTITISQEAHTKIKKYCVKNDLKINEWVEETLLDIIAD